MKGLILQEKKNKEKTNENNNERINELVISLKGKIIYYWMLIGWESGHLVLIKGIFGNQYMYM